MAIIRLTTQWLPQGGGLNTEALEVPIGTIIAFMGNTPPENYLACDGNIYRIADYRPLANFINLQFSSFNYFGGDGVDTFAVPDLRGEFLRGTGTNSRVNMGDGSSVGAHQDPTKHIFFYVGDRGGIFTDNPQNTYPLNTDNSVAIGNGTNRYYYNANDRDIFNTNIGFYLSRPTNTSVLYCIKYKNS